MAAPSEPPADAPAADTASPGTASPGTANHDAANHDAAPICSAKGCRAAATWALLWNNPKLHPPQRRKTWLACDAHRDQLSGFLNARGFLRDVTAAPG